MLTNITPLQDLFKEAENIQKVLEITISEDGTEATYHGNEIAVYMARTGKMLADAKYHLNQKKQSEIIESLRKIAKDTPHATAKAVNALVDSACKEEQYLVDWIGRINAAATHKLEWCRTVISKAKEEMRLAGMQPTR